MTNLATPAPGESYALYRHFDAQDRLLYVGISGSLRIREGIHKSTSMWRSLLARSIVERFEDADEAMKAERIAIETERPLFNVRHNAPRAGERLRAYLEETGHADWMRHWPSPAVSGDEARRLITSAARDLREKG